MVALIAAMCYAGGMMCGSPTLMDAFPDILQCSAALERVKQTPNYVALQHAQNGGTLRAYCQLSTPQWEIK